MRSSELSWRLEALALVGATGFTPGEALETSPCLPSVLSAGLAGASVWARPFIGQTMRYMCLLFCDFLSCILSCIPALQASNSLLPLPLAPSPHESAAAAMHELPPSRAATCCSVPLVGRRQPSAATPTHCCCCRFAFCECAGAALHPPLLDCVPALVQRPAAAAALGQTQHPQQPASSHLR